MILITGDLHGEHDIQKFSVSCFPLQKQLSRKDYVIICGDFGLVWRDSSEERQWLKWLEDKPWTTLWIDGNHENFARLKAFPTERWHGGLIQKITPHIFHLCRGQIFQLEEYRIFAMGGAESHDKNIGSQGYHGGRKNFLQKRKFKMPQLHWSKRTGTWILYSPTAFPQKFSTRCLKG